MTYKSSAYFIYENDSIDFMDDIKKNQYNCKIYPLHIEEFIDVSHKFNPEIRHVVISISAEFISDVLAVIYKNEFSLGIIPLESQKKSIKNFHLSDDMLQIMEVALRDDSKSVDLIQINGSFTHIQGVIGTVPLVGESLKTRSSLYRSFFYGVRKFFSLEFQQFEIVTENGQKIITAGIAIVVLNHLKNGFMDKIFHIDSSMRDGKVTLVIFSPSSMFEYISLISLIFTNHKAKKTLPPSVGYIQSKSFTITASSSKRLSFDGANSIALPLECKVIPQAIKINANEEFWLENEPKDSSKETMKISNLPDSSESLKYMSKHIPLLKSASEERFKELFLILRGDAKTNSTYLVLMVLSTLLAVFGLFANSTAVIIGAMLVAPLMIPIVSVSMGLLRGDNNIIRDSLIKIGVGVILALFASSLLASLLPSFEITSEMLSRVNPTLLDLGIAILSGIAAAYSKSFKEISQNLAGVAIAVALVPPLAVAGIGLGYGELGIFLGAFLLFFTNLVGIIIAAILTFQLLGFSSVVKSKKSVGFIFVLLMAISYPLYLSTNHMIQKYEMIQKLKEHRFLVNNKYVIIDNVSVIFKGDIKILNLNLLVRESLDRSDFEALQKDIEQLFDSKLIIKAKVEYIL